MVTAWQQCLAWPGLFPVIKPSRMSAGYPSPRPHQWRPILHLLTHAFHTQTSSCLRSHGEEMWPALGGGVWRLVSPCFTFQTFTDWCRHAAPLQIAHQTPLISPLERLLSCVMGPFSGSQEIPHSAEVMGGGDAQLQLSRFSNSPTAASFLAFSPPVLKNNKSPHGCREPAREESFSSNQRNKQSRKESGELIQN